MGNQKQPASSTVPLSPETCEFCRHGRPADPEGNQIACFWGPPTPVMVGMQINRFTKQQEPVFHSLRTMLLKSETCGQFSARPAIDLTVNFQAQN